MIIDTTASKFERVTEDLKTAPKKKTFHMQISIDFNGCVIHKNCKNVNEVSNGIEWTTSFVDDFKNLAGNETNTYTFSSAPFIKTFSSTPVIFNAYARDNLRAIDQFLSTHKLDFPQESANNEEKNPWSKKLSFSAIHEMAKIVRGKTEGAYWRSTDRSVAVIGAGTTEEASSHSDQLEFNW